MAETDQGAADRESLIRNLLAGEYSNPVCVVAFNVAEGLSRDVTEDIANELLRVCTERDEIPHAIPDFIIQHTQ